MSMFYVQLIKLCLAYKALWNASLDRTCLVELGSSFQRTLPTKRMEDLPEGPGRKGICNRRVSCPLVILRELLALSETDKFPVLLAKWLVSLTSVREVPGAIPTGSRFFCAGTHGIGYSWPGMRVKCIQYTVGSVLLGIRARWDVDVKQNTFTFFLPLQIILGKQ